MSSSAAAGKSALSCAPAGTNWLPPPPSPSPRLPELDAVGDDLDGLALAAAVLRLPLAPLEAAVDRDRPALREVLRAALGLVAEDGDAEVVRLVRPLPGLVAPPAVDG